MSQPPTDQREQLRGMAISDTAIKYPVFVSMLMLLSVVIGLLAYSALPVNFLPDIAAPTVSVSVSYPGAGPESVAQQVTEPIEEAVNTISGVAGITSSSNEGLAQITIEFEGSVNGDAALQDVREKVNAILPRLPSSVNDPIYQQFDLGALPILQLAIAADGSLSPLELRGLIDNTFVPSLQRVSGVGSVNVSGGQVRQINVYLDLARLETYQVTPAQVSSAIRNANNDQGLGAIDSGDQSFSLRTTSQLAAPEDIASIPIAGTRYRVGDLAEVVDSADEPDSYARLDGQDAVTLSVVKRSGTNTVSVAEGVRAELEQLFARHPNLRYVVTSDQSIQVTSAVASSIEEMVLAVVAAFLVVLLFFRNLRNTLITIAGLPVILIATFALMQLFGISINVISLLALSLSVGLVIDDAIVVRENIFRFSERGYAPKQAASRGTAEVALSVLAMTLTIIAVFLPVALTSGTTGFIFKAFGITVACAMALSLFEAFTFAPMLSAYLFSEKGHQHADAPPAGAGDDLLEGQEELGWLSRGYERLLGWSLRHRFTTVGIAVLVLVLSVVVASGMRVAFLPPQSSDTIAVSFQLPPGSSLAATDRLARQAEAIIVQDPDISAVQSNVGATADEQGSFVLRLHSSESADAVRARMREQLTFLPELVFGAQSFQGGGTGVTARNLQVRLRTVGSLAELAPLADQVRQTVRGVPGTADVGSTYNVGRPEIQFTVDNAKAGQLGISNNDLASSVRALINGDTATTLRRGGEDVDVVVRLAPSQRADIDTLNALSLPTAGGSVPLNSVATVAISAGPTSIRRSDQQNEIVIGANVVEGVNQSQVQQALQAALRDIALPPGVTISFGGDQQDQAEGFGSLFLAMGLSVLFVYMVLASQFNSFAQPLVIMLAMPFSFLGAFVALRLTGQALDITGMIGLIMLLGLVVKNSILLVDFTNQLQARGLDKHSALALAGAIRLRPILMTSIAVIAGAVPTALGIHFFSSGEGGEFRRGLAVVLIGGMFTSTVLTLLVVPTAYSLLESTTRRMGRLLRRRPGPATGSAAPAQPAEAAQEQGSAAAS